VNPPYPHVFDVIMKFSDCTIVLVADPRAPYAYPPMQPDATTVAPRARRLPWLDICALLATAQVLLAGYRFGVGNQSIQVPFLKHLIDPSLFSRDPLITTLGDYPTLFYRALAWVLPSTDAIPGAYMVLHLLTAFLVLAAAYALARGLAGRDLAGLVMVLVLVAGHQAGIAAEGDVVEVIDLLARRGAVGSEVEEDRQLVVGVCPNYPCS
jgi:hypothetical protein